MSREEQTYVAQALSEVLQNENQIRQKGEEKLN